MLVEGVLLASISGAAALVLAAWSADLLSAFSLPSPVPQRLHFVIDARIVGFTLALVALAGVLPALIPAVQASRSDVRQVMGSQPVIGVRRSRVRNLFVLAQVAGSTLFLAAALLFVRSFWNAASFAPGFDVDHTLVLELNPASFGYDAERAQGLFGSLVERLRGVRGIEAVALADRAPFSIGFPKTVDVARDLDECSGPRCRTAIEFGISADHFAALGLPLRAGRELTAQEVRANAPVVVVGEGMAEALWPRARPGRSVAARRPRSAAGGSRRRRGRRAGHVLGRRRPAPTSIVRCDRASTPIASPSSCGLRAIPRRLPRSCASRSRRSIRRCRRRRSAPRGSG